MCPFPYTFRPQMNFFYNNFFHKILKNNYLA